LREDLRVNDETVPAWAIDWREPHENAARTQVEPHSLVGRLFNGNRAGFAAALPRYNGPARCIAAASVEGSPMGCEGVGTAE